MGKHSNGDQKRGGGKFAYVSRVALALLLASAGVLAVVFSNIVRQWEAAGSAFAMSFVTPGQSFAIGQVAYFGMGTNTPRGIDITELCSAIVVVAPLMILAALMMVLKRFKVSTVLIALAVGLGIVVVANLVRMAAIAFGWDRFGQSGFNAVHLGYGSIFALLAFATGILVFLRLSFGKKRSAQ